ncbi:ABC transporter substrate-binding protein [Microbacterium profundi]
MRGSHRAVALVAAALVLTLAGCSPALPESVVPDTKVVVGWTGAFTSTNAAASPTAGNIDIAQMTRGDFGDMVDGDFVPDEGFGTVEIVSDDPFTVRYDLAEPSWSDGIPLDAADLLMGWAAAAGYFEQDGEAETDAAAPDAADDDVPSIDEFARSIDVTSYPRSDWQTAVTAPVPAHVLGARALGIDDAMEAKQAVITAIQTDDATALQKMAEVWNEEFALDGGEIADDLMLSSGPFRVDEVTGSGQQVVLVPNAAYRGLMPPQVARIEFVPGGDDPLAAMGTELDVVQATPVAANKEPIRALERRDLVVSTTRDGTVWAVLLKPTGVFTSVQARTAFLHAVPASDLIERGAGEWRTSYSPTTSMTTSAESRAYEVVNQDSGFTQALGSTQGEPPLEREAAGIAAGARVCVLYDRGSEFAVGAFAAMRDTAAEAGWSITDCGSADFDAALEQRSWDAVIARVPLPQTPGDIAAQWGSDGTASIVRQSDPERDALIARLAETTDVYEARDVLAQIEATIVRAAVALPITGGPMLTIVDRDVTGVAPRNGAVASLTSGVSQWAAVP